MITIISLIHIRSCLLCYTGVEHSYTLNCHIRLADISSLRPCTLSFEKLLSYPVQSEYSIL